MEKNLSIWFSVWFFGVFCVTEAGEQQIGWIPEKNRLFFDAVGKAFGLPNFHAKIDSASNKNTGDKFTEITFFYNL